VISTHVLDTERGRPAPGVRVELYRGEELIAAKETDKDGRIPDLAGEVEAGDYRLVFFPPSSPFFKRIEVEIAVDGGRLHVPLLLSPYSCTTYRGS
jgi:5-hydroxyisourate hydrolase-like protein (transthyretin family)